MPNEFEIGSFPVFRGASRCKAQSLKVLEEASEACEAARDCDRLVDLGRDGSDEMADARSRMLDEIADACQALSNLLAAWGVDGDEWAAAVGRCQQRNVDRGRY